jgi:hypothetical protein
MAYILEKYEKFLRLLESAGDNKNAIAEICTAMVLLNNQFLDNILDKGLKARYSENSTVFVNDLRNLLMANNRLYLGMMDEDGKFIEDPDRSKSQLAMSGVTFDIEKEWSKLTRYRNDARNIIDKLLPEKLTPEMIRKVFWTGPNKSDNETPDIVIELTTGKQYPIFIGRNLTSKKTSSFNRFAEDFIGLTSEDLFSEENMEKWDKLVQEFIRVTYENAHKPIQSHIEKFIDTKRIESIGYFEFFSIRHRDPRFKHLGEHMPEFDKNILLLHDLLNQIWKKPERFLSNPENATRDWDETKVVILNSRILEYTFSQAILRDRPEDVKRMDDGFKRTTGRTKMKLVKMFVEKLGCGEKDNFYLTKDHLFLLPSRSFFRENYDDIEVDFDYHVKFNVNTVDSEENNFKMRVKLSHNEKELATFTVIVKFSSGKFSEKLSASYNFDIPLSFNHSINTIRGDENSEDQ